MDFLKGRVEGDTSSSSVNYFPDYDDDIDFNDDAQSWPGELPWPELNLVTAIPGMPVGDPVIIDNENTGYCGYSETHDSGGWADSHG